MRRKTKIVVSCEASAAILEWPNLLARELYSAAIQHAGQHEVGIDDVHAAWTVAVERMTAQLAKQTSRTSSHRGKANDKAA